MSEYFSKPKAVKGNVKVKRDDLASLNSEINKLVF